MAMSNEVLDFTGNIFQVIFNNFPIFGDSFTKKPKTNSYKKCLSVYLVMMLDLKAVKETILYLYTIQNQQNLVKFLITNKTRSYSKILNIRIQY